MAEIVLNNLGLFLFAGLVVLGYLAGGWAERRHYRSIRRREEELLSIPVVTSEDILPGQPVARSCLVTGSVVVSTDYFKRLLANLRNLFGGRVGAYETLVDRARREAVLRMKEQARRRGACMVLNLRLETAAVGRSANKKGGLGSVEAVAYGTALVPPRG